VAAFAHASTNRLLLVQSVFAVLTIWIVLWFLWGAWFPVIAEAVDHLPEQGAIKSGRLEWTGDPVVRLAENRFLGFAVDLKHAGAARSPAHIQVEAGEHDLLLVGLLGHYRVPYQRHWIVGLGRQEAVAWWGAWAPIILALAGLATGVFLFVAWATLALLYAPVAWILGFFANRDLNLRASWRLAGAALMPGVLVMVATIFCYGVGWWDVLMLGAGTAAHLLAGWIYIVWSPFRALRLGGVPSLKENPFRGK
jgi:hypothetical protein